MHGHMNVKMYVSSTFIQVFSSIFLNVSLRATAVQDFMDDPPLNVTLICVKSLKLCLISGWVCCMSFQNEENYEHFQSHLITSWKRRQKQ
jgi:hypothetical protein